MKTSRCNLVFTIVSLKDSRDLMLRISKFLQNVEALKFGSDGVVHISVEYENFNER